MNSNHTLTQIIKKERTNVKVLSIVNLKGGVGKTATTCNLAYLLSQKGFRTLVIDLDGQANGSRQLGVPMTYTGKTVKDVYIGQNGIKQPLSSVLYDSPYKNLKLAPSSFDFVGAEILLKNEPQLSAEYRIKSSLEDVEGQFDFVLIDCPPALGDFVLNAMVASDLIIVPVNADDGSLEGLARAYGMRQQIEKMLRIQLNIKTLFTMWDHTKNSKECREELLETLSRDEIFETLIRRGTAVPSSKNAPVCSTKPTSNPAIDYKSLVEEVLMHVQVQSPGHDQTAAGRE